MGYGLATMIDFTFESTTSHSFLVARPQSGCKVIKHEAAMLARNSIGKLASVDIKHINGVPCCYYNITSKLSLAFFLKRKKLSRNEIIKLLADMTKEVLDSAGYLLSPRGFIFSSDHIFINPENLEISMIYVPFRSEQEIMNGFKEYVLSLVLEQADIEENDCDNFLQRIISYIKKDVFSFLEFLKLLDCLLGNEEVCPQVTDWSDELNTVVCNDAESSAERISLRLDSKRVAMVALTQLFIAGLVVLVVNYAGLPGGGSAANYSAVGIIAAAVDVIFLKNLLKGAFIKQPVEKKAIKEASKKSFDEPEAFNDNENTSCKKVSIAEKSLSCKTELLGASKPGFPVLKSRGRGIETDIVIDREDFIIGRLAGQVDYECTSAAVGKIHAQIINRDGKLFVIDLNSVNGTFVNNERLTSNSEYELKNSDYVAFANCEYTVFFNNERG